MTTPQPAEVEKHWSSKTMWNEGALLPAMVVALGGEQDRQ